MIVISCMSQIIKITMLISNHSNLTFLYLLIIIIIIMVVEANIEMPIPGCVFAVDDSNEPSQNLSIVSLLLTE